MLTEAETGTGGTPAGPDRAGSRRVPVGDATTADRPGRHRAARTAARIARRPGTHRLVALYGWATALGTVALASGLRGVALVLTGAVPPWYQPAVATLGFGGLALGLLALRGHTRPVLPWAALGLANVAVGVSTALTVNLP